MNPQPLTHDSLRRAQQDLIKRKSKKVQITLPNGQVRMHEGTCHKSHAVVVEVPHCGPRAKMDRRKRNVPHYERLKDAHEASPHDYAVHWFPNHSAALRFRREQWDKPRRTARNMFIERTRPV